MTRILIAEDEERIVAFVEKGLRDAGYTTVAVGIGTRSRSPATTRSTSWSSISASPAPMVTR